jgi:hypothetical protein
MMPFADCIQTLLQVTPHHRHHRRKGLLPAAPEVAGAVGVTAAFLPRQPLPSPSHGRGSCVAVAAAAGKALPAAWAACMARRRGSAAQVLQPVAVRAARESRGDGAPTTRNTCQEACCRCMREWSCMVKPGTRCCFQVGSSDGMQSTCASGAPPFPPAPHPPDAAWAKERFIIPCCVPHQPLRPQPRILHPARPTHGCVHSGGGPGRLPLQR